MGESMATAQEKGRFRHQSLSMKAKITLGFGLVLAFMIVISVFSISKINRSSKDFTSYRGLARETNLGGRLQANLLMARMSVKDFIISSNEKKLEQFNAYMENTQGFMAEARQHIHDPERAKRVAQADENLKNYQDTFSSVVDDQRKRDDLLNNVLNVKGPEMERALTKILVSAKEDSDMTAAYHASLATRSLLLARLYVAKFLASSEQSAVERVQSEFSQMEELLNTLDKELEKGGRRTLLMEVG